MWVSLPSPGKGNDSCHYLGRQEGMLERQVLALGFLDCVRVFVCSVCRKTPHVSHKMHETLFRFRSLDLRGPSQAGVLPFATAHS